MEITFTRTGERSYMTVVVRDDRVTIQVPSFDRPAWLPHDLAHYVVERALGLRQGFWGHVAAGAVFPGMTVVGGSPSNPFFPETVKHQRALSNKAMIL